MDPDEALKQLRHLVQTYRDGDMADPLAHHEEMVEYFEALDEWLSRDGYLPHDWKAEEDK